MQRYATRLFIDPTPTQTGIRFTAQPTAQCCQPELMILSIQPVISAGDESPVTPTLFALQGIRVASDRNSFAYFCGFYRPDRDYGIGYFTAPGG